MDNVREYAQQVADALVDVIETARWDARIPSIRDLALRAGMTHTALNKRMRRETPFNIRDLAAVAEALKIHPSELVRRAKAAVDDAGATVTPLPPSRPSTPSVQKRAARKKPGKPKIGDDD